MAQTAKDAKIAKRKYGFLYFLASFAHLAVLNGWCLQESAPIVRLAQACHPAHDIDYISGYR
jgi:hypothetical protein